MRNTVATRRTHSSDRKHSAAHDCWALAPLLLLLAVQPSASQAQQNDTAQAKSAIRVHTITSKYQAEPTKVRVLVPDDAKKVVGERRRFVFVLPVEARDGSRYGDGLREVEKLELHNTHNVICVAPTFSQLPWYADHPTNPKVRQESHLIKVVLPFVDEHYGKKGETPRRCLLGFSKSGWGAWCLLLRNPETFERAAAWDAPLTMKSSGKYGSGPIFGTQENFLMYHVPSLLAKSAGQLKEDKRLVLTGYGGFREHHKAIHSSMDQLGILHDYRDGPQKKHRWDGGWLTEAFELLLAK